MSKVLPSQTLARAQRKKRYKVDLPAQLIECEMNYHRLLRLLNNVKELAVGNIQHYIVGDHTVAESNFRVTVLEQTKYTTVVHIAQLFTLQNTSSLTKNDNMPIGSSLNEGLPVDGGLIDRCLSESDLANARQINTVEPVVKGSAKQGLAVSTVYQGDVRLYHDANVAEVVKCQRYQAFAPRYEYPNVDMHQIDEKVQMNRFLGALLNHCLSHGRVAGNVIPVNT